MKKDTFTDLVLYLWRRELSPAFVFPIVYVTTDCQVLLTTEILFSPYDHKHPPTKTDLSRLLFCLKDQPFNNTAAPSFSLPPTETPGKIWWGAKKEERWETSRYALHKWIHTNVWNDIHANKDEHKYLLSDKISSLSAFSCKVVYHWLAIMERTPVRLRSIAVSVGLSIAICRQLKKIKSMRSIN